MPETNILTAQLEGKLTPDATTKPTVNLCSRHARRLLGLYIKHDQLVSEVYIPPNNIFACFSQASDQPDFADYAKLTPTRQHNARLVLNVRVNRDGARRRIPYNALCSGPEGIPPFTPIRFSLVDLSHA